MTYEGVNSQYFLSNFLYLNFLETRVSQNILRKNIRIFSQKIVEKNHSKSFAFVPESFANLHPRACNIKLITAVIYCFPNKLECLS
jgi:hypothetical protein